MVMVMGDDDGGRDGDGHDKDGGLPRCCRQVHACIILMRHILNTEANEKKRDAHTVTILKHHSFRASQQHIMYRLEQITLVLRKVCTEDSRK